MTQLIQQGDVLIFSNVELPSDAVEVPAKHGRIVLAEGEVTGHAHAVGTMEFPGTKLFTSNGNMFLVCESAVEVFHEEHKAVKVPPGTHKICIVKEVDPFTEEIRSVQD